MGESTNRYCMYCDDFRERIPCEVCGHRTHSMTPVYDAFLDDCRKRLAGRAALTQETSDAEA